MAAMEIIQLAHIRNRMKLTRQALQLDSEFIGVVKFTIPPLFHVLEVFESDVFAHFIISHIRFDIGEILDMGQFLDG